MTVPLIIPNSRHTCYAPTLIIFMNRPLQLSLVRHAESARNAAKGQNIYFTDDEARKNVKGIPDQEISITLKGQEQAKITGVKLREEFGTFDYVYHSGYKRTRDTAEAILNAYSAEERLRVKVRENLFIRERDPGYTYDMTEDEVLQHFPWFPEYWKTFGGFLSRPVGGESLAQVVERVYTFLNMLFRDRAGKKILVVTHGGTLRCFRYLLERWTYDQALKWPDGQSPKNCGVTTYMYDREQERLILKNYNKVYY